MKRTGIYVRCSKKDQTVEQQLAQLRQYCKDSKIEVIEEYVDEGVSATKANRPAFMRLLEDIRRKKVNFVLVYKIDRFSRSVKELLSTIDIIKEYGADFVSYTQRELDTTTSSGKLMFGLMAIISEFERDIISERTKLKLGYYNDQIKKNGHFVTKTGVKKKTLGRPGKYDHNEMTRLRKQGLSLNAIARKLKCNVGTVSQVLKKGGQTLCTKTT